MFGGLAGFSPREYTEWVPRKGAETESINRMEQYVKKHVLTGIYRQNHVRIVVISKETSLNEVLHLCDGSASLEI